MTEEQELEQIEEGKRHIQEMIQAKAPIPVHEIIVVHMIFDNGPSRGWVHTHGMHEMFNLPDLEIIGVHPLYLMEAAGGLLNYVAQYMVDSLNGLRGAKPVKVGQTFGADPLTIVRFVESTPIDKSDKDAIETHYKTPRLRLVEVPETFVCQHGDHSINVGSGRN